VPQHLGKKPLKLFLGIQYDVEGDRSESKEKWIKEQARERMETAMGK
jgi:hypothetical protein